jgi:hypothetical protein
LLVNASCPRPKTASPSRESAITRAFRAPTLADSVPDEVKTRICRVPEEEFDFLGYTFGRMYSARTGQARLGYRPSKKSITFVPKPAQTYEPEVLVEMREWIAPALAPPDLVLEAPNDDRAISADASAAPVSPNWTIPPPAKRWARQCSAA